MRKRIPDPNVWLIYLVIFLLGLAYGISISVVSLFLDRHGFRKQEIGSLAVWFALGIVALSLPMGALIRRFSARTMLIVSLLGYAMAVAAFPFAPSYPAFAAIRFVDGACSVGVWVCCETILLSRAGDKNKAYVTSLYAIAIALGYVIGPLVAKLVILLGPMSTAFVISGCIALADAILVMARLDPDVRHESVASSSEAADAPQATRFSAILWRIKTSCFATFSYGYFQASVVLFLPLYLRDVKHVTEPQTLLIPAFFAGGMLLFSNIAGRLGDRYGHLALMRVLGVVGTMMILGFVFLDAYWIMCIAVFVAGASLASISPVSLALQGVVTSQGDLSRSNAIYNTFYAAGMLLGPWISSRIYDARGGVPMLFHLSAIWVVFIVFTIAFYRDDPAARRKTSALEAQG